MRVLLMAAVCAALPVAAVAAPVFLPTQDVAVSYAFSAPGRSSATYELRYNAADQLARIENPAQGVFILANLPGGQAQVVIPALHAVVQSPDFSALTGVVYNADGATFTPLGAGHYAGLACEKYLVLDAHGSGSACITPQGVVLHFAGRDANGSAEVTALNVAFGPQPGAEFVAPDGFQAIQLPPGALAALLGQ